MAKSAWAKSAGKISKLVRRDLVEVFVSEPIQDSVGEIYDYMQESIGVFKANVTTPTDYIVEEEQGTVRPHNYQITFDVDVPFPQDKKIFLRIVKSRQGMEGVLLEVQSLAGGLLGQTLLATDEAN